MVRYRDRYRHRYRDQNKTTSGHEKPDVSQLLTGYLAWVYKMAAGLAGIYRNARDQWLRARQSSLIAIAIPIPMAIPIAIAIPIPIPIPIPVAIPQIRYNQEF